MSDPIRRVGGSIPGPGDVGPTGEAGASKEAFRAALDATTNVDAPTGAVAPTGVGATTELRDPAAIAGALKTGAVTPEQAIDALVAKTLESPMALSLSPAGRADLERTLRSALANDPTLLAMQADLGR